MTLTKPFQIGTMEEYVYDTDGQRIKIIKNDSANTTIYTPFKEFMRITNLSGSFDYTYIYDGDTLIARKNPDGSVQYNHLDHLGSVGVVTNSTGGVIEQTTYSPFGEELSGGNADVKGYTGQYDDEATGQMYYGARYYKPGTVQFISPDSLLPNVFDSQQLNRYAYARNNPYSYFDEDGQRITYNEEYNPNLGNIIAIYQDDAYIGRVTMGIEQATTYPSIFENGQAMEVTTYDYMIQSGSKTLGTDGTPVIIDSFNTQRKLSEITLEDRERLLKQENLEWAEAGLFDIASVGGFLGSNSLKRVSQIGSAKSGASAIYNRDYMTAIGVIPIPGVSLLSQYLNQNLGYQPYQRIPEFKGFTRRESRTLGGGGVVRRSSSSSFVMNNPSGGGSLLVTITRVK